MEVIFAVRKAILSIIYLKPYCLGVMVLEDANLILLMLFHTHSLGWLGECRRMARIVVLVLLSYAPACLSADTVLPVLTTDTRLASAGYYQLSWQPGVAGALNKKISFELQQSNEPSFKTVTTVYRGPDRASVVSGQPDGDYFYRIRQVNPSQSSSDWSKPILVKVQHHSLRKAWLFFVAGASVFFMTLFFIVAAARNGDKA